MRDIYRSSHFHLVVDEGARIVRRVRTAEPFTSLASLKAEYDGLLAAMESTYRGRYAQLVDVRLAPPRNDPEFEKVITPLHPRLYAGFCASAVLVQTAAGRLQLRRMLATLPGGEVPVFLDEGEAMGYLRLKAEA
jgi:hypothetical protein